MNLSDHRKKASLAGLVEKDLATTLDLLPARLGGAAENIAVDFLLLKRYPTPANARFRHYDWHQPTYTFGYSQKISFVRDQLPSDDAIALCRRPTAGGIVDHRNDWTYALVIPRAHALYDAPAPESYRLIHTCIADILIALGQPIALKKETDAPAAETDNPAEPTRSFTRPDLHDVIRTDTGEKVASAAQKRTKEGLLFQGSIARNTISNTIDWDAFEAGFIAQLSRALAIKAAPAPWPDFAEHELEGLMEQYTSPEWNDFR